MNSNNRVAPWRITSNLTGRSQVSSCCANRDRECQSAIFTSSSYGKSLLSLPHQILTERRRRRSGAVQLECGLGTGLKCPFTQFNAARMLLPSLDHSEICIER